ncbi:MAG: hypothetical protein ACPL68_04335, partial [Candidatus Hydrothermia bacterium]
GTFCPREQVLRGATYKIPPRGHFLRVLDMMRLPDKDKLGSSGFQDLEPLPQNLSGFHRY